MARSTKIILTTRKERLVMRHILEHMERSTYWLQYGHNDLDSINDHNAWRDVDVEKITGMGGHDVFRILSAKGYISNWDGSGWGSYVVTDKGHMYFELDNERRRDIIMRSILLPILLAAITSVMMPKIVDALETYLSSNRQPKTELSLEHTPTDSPSSDR